MSPILGSSLAWQASTINAFDVVVIAKKHTTINYHNLADWAKIIIDTRNAMKEIALKGCIIYKA